MNVSFPWKNENGQVEIIQYNLRSAKLDWEESLILNRMATGTIEIYLSAIDNLMWVCGKTNPVNDISFQDIEKMKQKIAHLSDATINMKLRAINTFFIWLCDNEKVTSMPKIKKFSINRKLPSYYLEEEVELVQSFVDDELLRRMYRFYRDTGCGLFEPFNSTMTSTGLKIPSGRTKNSYERTMYLNEQQISIVKDMRAWISAKVDNNKSQKKWAVRHILRIWNTACKKAGLNKRRLHYLRHTFAVMEWLRTGDIYLVCKKLRHFSVTTTEIYTKLELYQLREDFPSLSRNLDGGGQFLVGSKTSDYNYGKAL